MWQVLDDNELMRAFELRFSSQSKKGYDIFRKWGCK